MKLEWGKLPPGRVGVFHSWGLGDLIMATPMLQSLARSGHQVELILTSDYTPILKGAPFLERVWVLKRKVELLKFFRRFDYLVGTGGINPRKVKFLGTLLGVKKVFASSPIRNLHRIELNLRLASQLITEVVREPYLYIDQSLEGVKGYFKGEGPFLGFAVGSGGKQKFKRWPYFRELIPQLPGRKFIFIGPDEVELKREFQSVGEILQLGLGELPGFISRLNLLVGNDNGVMHIGYGVGVNTATIIGMTNHLETGGYRSNNWHIFLNLECRPCFDPATNRLGCSNYRCLTDLPISKVREECLKILKSQF
ncbi:MAG: glycosyltransferase family 9 protein [Campylobacterales bacterium]